MPDPAGGHPPVSSTQRKPGAARNLTFSPVLSVRLNVKRSGGDPLGKLTEPLLLEDITTVLSTRSAVRLVCAINRSLSITDSSFFIIIPLAEVHALLSSGSR